MGAMSSGEERSREFSDWWRGAGESELRQLLYWVWDPLGVSESFPDAVDEYDGYALEIATALASGISQSALVALLTSIEQHRMGIARRSLQPVVEQLLAWHERSTERWANKRQPASGAVVASDP